MDASFWNSRYAANEFAYGEEPNLYFKEKVSMLSVGNALFPAEGEGRNAVYAAQLGWNASAFDPSMAGKEKALTLAANRKVTINYDVRDAGSFLEKNKNTFDLAVFCFTHFPSAERIPLHAQLAQTIKPGGHLIFEAFAKGHELYNEKQPEVGGPRDPNHLFSEDEMKLILQDFDIMEMNKKEVQLDEGIYHRGLGLVLRVFAQRKQHSL